MRVLLRLYIDPAAATLAAGAQLALPELAARHVQVRRAQPGDALVLFDGLGREARAVVRAMGRRDVAVQVESVATIDRELPLTVTLAVGMPANERMDALVEKLTELGMAALQPLVCERSVLRLQGERSLRRSAHWQAIAIAAAEQCGRTRVPQIARPRDFAAWLAALARSGPGSASAQEPESESEWKWEWESGAAAAPAPSARWLLSLDRGALAPAVALASCAKARSLLVLSGPEGGLAPAERAAARAAGFVDVSLGARVLRADTAPLALLAWLGTAVAADG